MTIKCVGCKTELGQRCPECRSRNVKHMGGYSFKCNNCARRFMKDEGGFENGQCAKCIREGQQGRLAFSGESLPYTAWRSRKAKNELETQTDKASSAA